MVEERLNYPVNHRYQIIAFSTFNIITSQRTSLYQIATCTFQLIIANGFDIRTDIEILQASYLGYETKQERIGGRRVVNFFLKESSQALDK